MKTDSFAAESTDASDRKSGSLSILFKSGLLFAALLALAISPGCASRQAGGGDQAPSSRTIQLSDRRVTAYVILVPGNAKVYEKKAAEELQLYLGKITGATFPVVAEGGQRPAGPIVSVGLTKRFAKAFPTMDLAKLGADGIILKSRGQDLFLVGEGNRGTLYAVYELLERYAGVHWWTKTEEFVPSIQKLTVPALDVTYTPKLIYRDPYYWEFHSQDCGQFRAHRRTTQGNPPELGGGNPVSGSHTFLQLIPRERYGKDYPDWFGTRSVQLCLSNDEMRRELTKNALQQLRRNPTMTTLSVSQEDNPGPMCQCHKCRAAEAEEGSPSGPLIRFVNRVAEEIEREFPRVTVTTLAYQITRKPPKRVRPRANVMVMLCTFECSFSQTLEHGADNRSFREDLLGWAEICDKLYVWDYLTNFKGYLLPHPNLHVMGPNIRFLSRNKVIGLFNQGDAVTPCGDFHKLRANVQSRLMWNPELDPNALIREFLDGYYGPAALPLQRIVNFYQQAIEKSGKRLSLEALDTSDWLSLEGLNYLTREYAEAMRLAGDNATLIRRVQMARMGLDLAWLVRYNALKRSARINRLAFGGPDAPLAACREFIKRAADFNLEWVYENGPRFPQYAERLLKSFAPLPPATVPEQCAGLESDEWQDIQDHIFTTYDRASAIKDPNASDGSAIKQLNNTGWSTQTPIPLEMVADGLWHCYVVAKYDAQPGAPATGTAFELGVWKADPRNKVMVPLEPAAAGKYKTYDLGILPEKSGMVFYASSVNNPKAVAAFCIDRVFLVLEKKAGIPRKSE